MSMRYFPALLVLLAGCASRSAPPPVRAPVARTSQPAPARQMVAVEEPQPGPPTTPVAAPAQNADYVPTAADQVFAHRVLDLIDEVAAVMERRQDDPDRMAAELELVMQRNQDLIVAGKQMKGNLARD